MSLPPPDDLNKLPQPPRAKRTFEDLVKDVEKKHPIPDDLKIPVLPPSEEAVKEVVDYLKSVGLQVVDKVPSSIFIGAEIIDRAKIREGRIGRVRSTCVFAFAYVHADQKLRAIYVVPRDGIRARMVAKGVIWGLIADVRDNIAHSEIVPWEQLFAIETININELMDAPLLEAAKSENRAMWVGQVVKLEQTLKRRDWELDQLRKQIAQSTHKESGNHSEQDLRTQYLREQHRAEKWKVAAIIAVCVAILQIAPTAMAWIR